MAVVSHITFNDDLGSALGQVIVAGIVRDSPGIAPLRPVRVLNHYAVVYVTDGGGRFKDQLGFEHRLTPGDLLFLFPGVGHTYGPGQREFWYEIFIVFEGPIFELWQEKGLLNSRRPVLRLEPVDYWANRFKEAVWSVPQSGPDFALVRLCRLQQLLADILVYEQQSGYERIDQVWLAAAKTQLQANLHKPPDFEAMAQALGMSYDGFRKRFTRDLGLSPAKYRTLRRMDKACDLLLKEDLTLKEIALQLGFVDEFHFSKRFKQVIGVSPTGFRSLFGPK
jgi:AraC-like DNA-binding protein